MNLISFKSTRKDGEVFILSRTRRGEIRDENKVEDVHHSSVGKEDGIKKEKGGGTIRISSLGFRLE